MHFHCKIKRVYEKPAPEDGYRILVDRLWPRGIKKEEIALDEWNRDVAPSGELRKWYGHERDRFHQFSERYESELSNKKAELERIMAISKKGNITLLYAAKDAETSHAAVLLNYLKRNYETT